MRFYLFFFSMSCLAAREDNPRENLARGTLPGMYTGCCYTVMKPWVVLRVTAIKTRGVTAVIKVPTGGLEILLIPNQCACMTLPIPSTSVLHWP